MIKCLSCAPDRFCAHCAQLNFYQLCVLCKLCLQLGHQIGWVHFNLCQKRTTRLTEPVLISLWAVQFPIAVCVCVAHCARLVAKPDVDYAEFLYLYKKFFFLFCPRVHNTQIRWGHSKSTAGVAYSPLSTVSSQMAWLSFQLSYILYFGSALFCSVLFGCLLSVVLLRCQLIIFAFLMRFVENVSLPLEQRTAGEGLIVLDVAAAALIGHIFYL